MKVMWKQNSPCSAMGYPGYVRAQVTVILNQNSFAELTPFCLFIFVITHLKIYILAYPFFQKKQLGKKTWKTKQEAGWSKRYSWSIHKFCLVIRNRLSIFLTNANRFYSTDVRIRILVHQLIRGFRAFTLFFLALLSQLYWRKTEGYFGIINRWFTENLIYKVRYR